MANKKINKKIDKNIRKSIKRIPAGGVFAIVICLIVGAVGGFFAEKIITKNDCFELLGEKEIIVEIGSEYVYEEDGYKVISFGRDIANKVVVNTNLTNNEDGTYSMDTSEEGEYYMIYTVDDIKYGKIQRVRVFYVGGKNE